MRRPTIVIVEPEAEQALSVRKLVVETAKFNVLTVHGEDELRDTIRDFPKVDAVVIHSAFQAGNTTGTIQQFKKQAPGVPVIALSPLVDKMAADYRISSHEPEELVRILRQLFGDPRGIHTV